MSADHEVVVVAIEPMTRQADVVREIGRAERHADGAVLRQNRALLVRRELREASAPAQRIPDRPAPVLVQGRPPRTIDQRVAEVRLVSERIRAGRTWRSPVSARGARTDPRRAAAARHRGSRPGSARHASTPTPCGSLRSSYSGAGQPTGRQVSPRRPRTSRHPPNAISCMNRRSSERCGSPFLQAALLAEIGRLQTCAPSRSRRRNSVVSSLEITSWTKAAPDGSACGSQPPPARAECRRRSPAHSAGTGRPPRESSRSTLNIRKRMPSI